MRRMLAGALALALVVPACTVRRDDAGPAAPPPTGTTPVPSTPAPAPTSARPVPSESATDAAATYPRQRLAWESCGGGFQCATLQVPLDYAAPRGRRISVSVIRLPASGGRDARIGSLVLNPGGPGGSGVEFARTARQLLPAGIRARFDTVSFDPRGVGRSTPVECVDDRELDRILAVDPTPDDAAEKQRLVDVSRRQAEACGQRSRELLAHVSTSNVARDMEVLRAALGDPKLTYVGFSYGTVLGARYAELFPDRVRALVLDGAVDPRLEPMQTALAQAEGFERALAAFLKWCAGTSRCGFRSHGRDLGAAFDRLMADIDREPIAASSYPGRLLGPSEALFGVAAGLYSREWGWPALAQGLTEASGGDGSTLLALFDNLVERDEDGSYSNATEALVAVSCVDGNHARDVAAYDAAAERFAAAAPRFGRAIAYGGLPCAFWPVPPVERAGPVRAPGSPPILVIGTTGDPATPYAWSQALARQLPKGVLLTYVGDGHTAYGYGRSSCVNRVVDAYLTTLATPATGTRC